MRFEFIAEQPVLDFVATLAERGSTDDERLRTPADLEQWLAEARLVDQPIKISADELAAARQGREAMFALIAALIDGSSPRPRDRQLVNRLAAHPPPVRRLTPAGQLTASGDLDSVLALLADQCLALFASPDLDRLRLCAAPRCTRPYVDRSRAGQRRWCDMKSCGDKMKAAAYRERIRHS